MRRSTSTARGRPPVNFWLWPQCGLAERPLSPGAWRTKGFFCFRVGIRRNRTTSTWKQNGEMRNSGESAGFMADLEILLAARPEAPGIDRYFVVGPSGRGRAQADGALAAEIRFR